MTAVAAGGYPVCFVVVVAAAAAAVRRRVFVVVSPPISRTSRTLLSRGK